MAIPPVEDKILYSKATPPLNADLAAELTSFWEAIFANSYETFRKVLEGSEQELNHNILYIARQESKLVGTCQVTISGSNPRLGGLGEVATAETHRGQGVASSLSAQARDDFLAAGGEALLLGTVNPQAARLYQRLGWRKLALANVMCLLESDQSPEDFLLDYLPNSGSVTVTVGSPACRIDMIPLILHPHDQHILDINAKIFSTQYTVQSSCLGLYPRYASIAEDAGGEWFVATTSTGQPVGLATASRQNSSAIRIDAFSHHLFPEASRELLIRCFDWASQQGVQQCLAEVAVDDTKKLSLLKTLGFSRSGEELQLNIEETTIPTICFSKDCADGSVSRT